MLGARFFGRVFRDRSAASKPVGHPIAALSVSQEQVLTLLLHLAHDGDCVRPPFPTTWFNVDLTGKFCPATMDANCNCLNGRNGPICTCSSSQAYDTASKACKGEPQGPSWRIGEGVQRVGMSLRHAQKRDDPAYVRVFM